MQLFSARSIEYKLHEKLFNGYDKTIRPVADVRDKLDVQLQPLLYSLLQVVNHCFEFLIIPR